MRSYSMRLHEVRIEPYFQHYFDTRPLAPARGEMFTRPDTGVPTEQFFAKLEPKDHAQVLAWLLEVAADVLASTGLQSSINVDPAMVATPRARQDFLRIAGEAACPVTFEFAGIPADWSDDDVAKLFAQIRERDHLAALDNFGRGEPDLNLLTRVRFDTVKIAGSLTSNLEDNPVFQARLENIYFALTDAGIGHVVQGVESQAAYQWLQELGYTTFQGFWFGIPAPAEHLVVE